MRKSTIAFIGKNKDLGFKNPKKITFTNEISSAKKFVPGVGKYKPNFKLNQNPTWKRGFDLALIKIQ